MLWAIRERHSKTSFRKICHEARNTTHLASQINYFPARRWYAQAIAKHGGSRMSTVSNVFARVDVAIPAYWEEQATNDSTQGRQMMVVPMINEVGSSPVLARHAGHIPQVLLISILGLTSQWRATVLLFAMSALCRIALCVHATDPSTLLCLLKLGSLHHVALYSPRTPCLPQLNPLVGYTQPAFKVTRRIDDAPRPQTVIQPHLQPSVQS
jgi:hypothetical protein